MLFNGIRVDLSKDLKYDYTYKPPGHDMPAKPWQRSPIDDLLGPGEKLLWAGRPPQKLVMFNIGDLFLIPFFLVWTGFACFWELAAIGIFLSDPASPAIIMPLFGLPFVAIGFFMLGGRFAGDVMVRRSTYYALTDRRVMIVTGRKGQTVTSVPLEKIENIGMMIHRNGTGTLNFTGVPGMAMLGSATVYARSTGKGVNTPPLFDHIVEPKKVYDMVMKAQDDLTVRQHGYTPQMRETEGER
jgi:hypothetical protein